MEFKGTKGKWRVKHLDDIFIENEDGKQVCEIQANGINDYKEWRQNALLISKAPEILEFIKSFVNGFECDYVLDGEIVGNPYKWLIDEYKEAKQLIKEATTI